MNASVESEASDLAGTRISHYLLEERIARGGMGVVYRAVDERLGRQVALKFLSGISPRTAETRQRFAQEARAASSLDHPNICTIFDVGDGPGGELFIAMPWYDGETLDRIIARGPLPLARAISIAMQVARGLAAAHEELIVHRDIKPANIIVMARDTVKILDFGLAKLTGTTTSHPGLMIGTPAYMAPEQLRGETVDQRADIWSAGVVLYEMLAGRSPFPGENLQAIARAILEDDLPPLTRARPDLPPRIDRIIQRSMARSPAVRYDRIELMIDDLQALQADLDSGGITIRRPAIARTTSLAVLPFLDMSPGKDQEYLCDGIAEEILAALRRIPDLYVASRTSAFQFKGRAADVREIGERLNVGHVLEGSVRRVGERVRVSAQLVNVADGYRLWYERYDRDMKDIFEIEEEIAGRIAHALQVTLTSSGAPLSEIEAEAYELYLQGLQFFHQHRRKGFEIALQTFSRAIEIDPRYARAWAGIADCNAFLNLYFGQGADRVIAADEASLKAIGLAPDLAEARTSRGLALFLRGELAAAERELRRAIEIDPMLYEAHYFSGRVDFTEGKIEQAAARFREACALVPEAYDSWYLLGMCYRKTGDSDRARSADLECVEAAQKRVRLHPEDTRAWTMGAAVFAELGEPERALQWVDRALAIDPDESIISYNAACVYVTLGERGRALDCLERVFREGGPSLEWVRNDPDLDPLRDEPRFQALLAGMGNVEC